MTSSPGRCPQRMRSLAAATVLAACPAAAAGSFDGGGSPGSVPPPVATPAVEAPAGPTSPPPVEGSPALAQSLGGSPGGWVPASPDDEPGDTTPGAPERIGFWDRLQDKAFDQICKNIKPRVGQSAPLGEAGSVAGRVDRKLARTAAGTFALVDTARVELSLGYGLQVLETDEGPVTLSLGSSIRGESAVVRPLGAKKSCDELDRLFNLFDYKVALPLSPARLAAMQVGEVWKIPVALNVGVGVGAQAAEFPVWVGIGRGKESRVSVSLYRWREDALRLRLRIDKAEVRSAGGQVAYVLPGAALGLPGTETIILEQALRLANRQLSKALSRYLTARFAVSAGRRDGRQILIEYVLDPRDPVSMEALRDLLRGDLSALRLLTDLALNAGRSATGGKPAVEEAAEAAARHGGGLGRGAEFVGANDYSHRNRGFSLKLPVLFDYVTASGRGSDSVVIADDSGSRYEILQADKRNESGFLDIPLLGEITKHNTQRTAQVMTFQDSSGARAGPVAVFVRQEGFLRASALLAREMTAEADSMSKLIGVRGEGVNPDTRLPVDDLFPVESLTEPDPRPQPGVGDGPGERSKIYRRGMSVFTLVFNRKAIVDIAAAPALVVLRAFLNSLWGEDRRLLQTAIDVGKVGGDGTITYHDWDAARALGYWHSNEPEVRNILDDMALLVRRAAGLIADLVRVRLAPDANAQAGAFIKVLAGDGDSGLAYEEVVRVLVQLADPADIAGEFFLNVHKGLKGEKDVAVRLLLNKGPADNPLVGEASKNRGRFSEPSTLTD